MRQADSLAKRLTRYRFTAARLILAMAVAITLVRPAAHAGPLEDYERARQLYIFAAACRAAYSDHLGQIAADALADNGWTIEKYARSSDKADARFLLAKKTEGGQTVYLLAATGTETLKDVLTDLRFDKVYFAGRTPDELAANIDRKDVPKDAPRVHRGFFQYVQAALAIKERGQDGAPLLFTTVANNPDRKIYLIGHSLGGAAATISAAALVSMGADPDQLEIVTFGAPAVGNAAFRHQFEPRLNLTRVVMRGDPVTGVLESLVGGYEQFGRELLWPTPDNLPQEPHDMAVYLDAAMKNYYDKRRQALTAGVITASYRVLPAGGEPFVYVSPVVNNLPGPVSGEFYYMREALLGEYRDLFPAYIFADGEPADLADSLRTAAAAGCQWLVVPEFGGYRVKDETNQYYITFQQTVYRVKDGTLAGLETYGSGTRHLTPLEAAVHAVLGMSVQKTPWLR